jgi:glucosamine-6-phosphate deaminase
MQIVWCDSADEFNSTAAEAVLDAVADNPGLAVALPTGRTPVGLYTRLRACAAAGSVSFERARWFNLDEYVGLGADHPLSYARFLREHLLDGIGAADRNIRLLRGDASDLETECREYDRAISEAGGLDLAILGLGANGHIAFNEPGSDWTRTTHVTELSEQTRAANSPARGARPGGALEINIPRLGITMGIATLRAARRVLLLVAGDTKKDALSALRRGSPDRRWPMTSLLGHQEMTVVVDGRLRSTSA